MGGGGGGGRGGRGIHLYLRVPDVQGAEPLIGEGLCGTVEVRYSCGVRVGEGRGGEEEEEEEERHHSV